MTLVEWAAQETHSDQLLGGRLVRAGHAGDTTCDGVACGRR